MQQDLANKQIVVVGAGGAVGRAVVAGLCRRGARVFAANRSRLAQLPPGAQPLASDIASADGLDQMWHELATVSLWGVVITAGAFRGGQSITDAPAGDLDDLLWANTQLPWHVLRGAVSTLTPRGGRIVAVGADAATAAAPRRAAYAASKAALHSLVLSTAQETLHDGITVNGVLPSTIDTVQNREAMPLADHSQWVTVEQIVNVVAFLMGDESSGVSGALIPVRAPRRDA